MSTSNMEFIPDQFVTVIDANGESIPTLLLSDLLPLLNDICRRLDLLGIEIDRINDAS